MTCHRITLILAIGFGLCAVQAKAQTQTPQAQTPQTPRKEGQPAKSATALPAATAKGAHAKDIDVQTQLDRTAMWPGDHVTYTVQLICRPGVDILTDDLSADKLKLDGLKLVGNDTTRVVSPGDVTTYTFKYNLGAYIVNLATLKIGGLDVRYYVKRPGQRLEDAAPAGDVLVPGTVIALRSLLPDGQGHPLRDSRPTVARPAVFAALQPIGIALVLISFVPALLVLFAVGRKLAKRIHLSRRGSRAAVQSQLESVRGLDLGSVEGRREAYTRLNSAVRTHLHDAVGVNAPNLTPGEIGPALSQHGAKVPADLATSVLTSCETALYAPADMLPTSDACRQTLKEAQQVIATRS